ncbi:MAG: hypothetical protein RLZZ597_1898 [Cyanobacteriota bacterium]|jgi:hypothetical protein
MSLVLDTSFSPAYDDCAESWLQEFAASGISAELTRANADWLAGTAAVAEFLGETIARRQKVTSYITTGNARLLGHYAFLEDGAWFANPALGTVPYAKPKTPRIDEERHRPIKYETPPGAEAEPLAPHLGKAVFRRWGVRTWAEVLARPDIPVLITEGWKKALAAVEQGYPAICLRGVTQWHPKGERTLWPLLAQLAQSGRTLLIAFDQDEKLNTRSNVSRQAQQMGNAIARQDGKPKFLVWPIALGKGLDDALVSLPWEERADWLEQTVQQALSLKQYRRKATLIQAQALLASPPRVADRHTTGEYLPKLPDLVPGALHWLSATMNSGKTYRMGHDWVASWRRRGGVVLVLSPLNSLGQQTAKDWALPHIHDYFTDADSQQALATDISQARGLVCCLNSIHRAKGLLPQNRPLLLIIDEAAQVLTDAVQGGTLKKDWAARWEDTIAMMRRASQTGAIAIAEDGLDAATIDLVQHLSSSQQVIGIRHTKKLEPWDCTIYRGTPLSDYRRRLLARIQTGKPTLYVTTSQQEARRLAHWAKENGIDHERIDSQTNENGTYTAFFEDPDTWLKQRRPQLLILSPSAKTGLSIEGGVPVSEAYFESVWGYFPALDADTWKQLLGRYRPAVPRHIWTPAYITPGYGEGDKAWGITRGLEAEAAQYAHFGAFDQAALDSDDTRLRQYLAARGQRRWAQKIQGGEALATALAEAGHRVTRITEGITGDPATTTLWRKLQEQLARQDSDYHAGLTVDPTLHTLKWATEALSGLDTTYEQRCLAAKVKLLARFPGIDWNCSEIWYQAMFCPRYADTKNSPSTGPLAQGAALWAEADHCRDLWATDVQEAERILKQRLRAAHLLPTQAAQSLLAHLFKPGVEKLLAAGEIRPGGDVEQQMKALALQYRDEIARRWRITITEEMPEETVANKIARKFSLIVERDRKITLAGKRRWVCALTANDMWTALVAARQWALRGTNQLDSSFNKTVPSMAEPPSHSPTSAPEWGLSEPSGSPTRPSIGSITAA